MTDSSNTKDGLPKMPSSAPNAKIAGSPRDLRSPDGKPLQMMGLAVVPYETDSEFHPSVDEEVDIFTEFGDLRFVEGLPAPEELKKWLEADNVLIDCGELLGPIPAQRYVEAGLFSCGVSITVSHRGSSVPAVSLRLLPRGVMWLKEHYVPTPERHRRDYIPPELLGSIE